MIDIDIDKLLKRLPSKERDSKRRVKEEINLISSPTIGDLGHLLKKYNTCSKRR